MQVNRKSSGKSLVFEGTHPNFATDQFFTPCVKDDSEVLIQNVDLAAQVFYWLEVRPNENWGLEGSVFLSKYELEFLK